ncbi:SPOR domain-containing protein [Prevotella pallens]|jgi:sporulation and cell division repeat protein|uniref:HU domain-containing protein n=1 Tax=Prevotella pallens TaxID=60133 RepID=UPI001CAD7AC1|nr:SPOR domain-containing protein [Prevotella pallens]MBF1487967.1 HU-CCDC81 and SPOR domain-containing protein [Prevotella pallens]
MLRIDRHIEILLLENDCIIVPGLGGFVAYYSEAYYEEAENIYLPPYRTVGFNPVLKMNDSLLAQSYIETYDLSYPEAMREIELEVNSILDSLAEVGCFELKGLGVLKREGTDKIAFEPYEGGLLTPKYYGLYYFEIEKYHNKENTEEQSVLIKKERNTRQHSFYIDTDNDGEKQLNVSIKLIKDIVVAAFLITFIFVVGFTSEKHTNSIPKEIKSGVFCELFNSTESIKKQKSSLRKPKHLNGKIPTQTSNFYWSLVLASHVTEKNANGFIKKLQQEGFKDAYIYKGSGSVKVIYGRYKSAQIAANQLSNLRGNDSFEQAWILKIRSNI